MKGSIVFLFPCLLAVLLCLFLRIDLLRPSKKQQSLTFEASFEDHYLYSHAKTVSDFLKKKSQQLIFFGSLKCSLQVVPGFRLHHCSH